MTNTNNQKQRKIIFLTNSKPFIYGKTNKTYILIALTDGVTIKHRFICRTIKYINSHTKPSFRINDDGLFIKGGIEAINVFDKDTETFISNVINDIDVSNATIKYSVYDANDPELKKRIIDKYSIIKESIDEMTMQESPEEQTNVSVEVPEEQAMPTVQEDSSIYDKFINLEFNSASTKELQENVFFNEVEISDELINLLNDYDAKASERDNYTGSIEDAELSKLEISDAITETEAEIEKLKIKISDFNNQISAIDESIVNMNTSIENLSKELATSENIINSYIEASKIRKKDKEAEEFYNNLDDNQKNHFKCMIGEEFIANYIKSKFGADSIEEYISSRLSNIQPINNTNPSVNILNIDTTADEDAAFIEKARNHIIAVVQKRELPNNELIKAVVDRLNKSNLDTVTYTYISEELGLTQHYTLRFCEMLEKGDFGLRRPNRRHYPTKKKKTSESAKRAVETRRKNEAAKKELINKALEGGVNV